MGKVCMNCMEGTMTWVEQHQRYICGHCGYEEFPRDYETEHLDAKAENEKPKTHTRERKGEVVA